MSSQVSSPFQQSVDVIAQQYRHVRDFSEHLAEPLAIEDQVIQSMPDVSPTRWHLAIRLGFLRPSYYHVSQRIFERWK